MISRLKKKFQNDGWFWTLVALVAFPFRRIRRAWWSYVFERDVLKEQDHEKKFTTIYLKNGWGKGESRSGPGSNIRNTENIRKRLPEVINELGVNVLLDAPCGDLNWMQYLLPNLPCRYIGADIVAPMISELAERLESETVSFMHLDIVNDSLPDADFVFSRDFLFHLSYRDTLRFLNNFLASKAEFLCTTSHRCSGDFTNSDITTGDFRLLDLFSNPYGFPKSFRCEIEDSGESSLKRSMFVWNREAIHGVVENLEKGLI